MLESYHLLPNSITKKSRMKLVILLGFAGYFLASSGGNHSPLESMNREDQATTSDPSVCVPYLEQACAAAAKNLNRPLEKGTWDTKGCYYYKTGKYTEKVYFSDGGTEDEGTMKEEMKTCDIRSSQFRPKGYDCKTDCNSDDDCNQLYPSCQEGTCQQCGSDDQCGDGLICKLNSFTCGTKCEPYSIQDCKDAGVRMGRIFSQGNWGNKGCYFYTDGRYEFDIFYGTNGTDDQKEISSALNSTVVARPFGLDCKFDGCVNTDNGCEKDKKGFSCDDFPYAFSDVSENEDYKREMDCGQDDDDDFQASSMCCSCKHL